MPSALIDLADAGDSFIALWGDFLTLVTGEYTNSQRLEFSILAAVGASKGPDTPAAPFPGAAYYPDEAQMFYACRLPVAGANVAALLATDFPWAPRAAVARDGYRVHTTVVHRIRAVAERLHRERVERLQRLLVLLRQGDTEATAELARLEQQPAAPPPDAVEWGGRPTEQLDGPRELE